MARFTFRPSLFFRRNTSAQTVSPSTSPLPPTKTSSSPLDPSKTTPQARRPSDLLHPRPSTADPDSLPADHDAVLHDTHPEPIPRPSLSDRAHSEPAYDAAVEQQAIEPVWDNTAKGDSAGPPPVPAVTLEHPTPDASEEQRSQGREIELSVEEALVGRPRKQSLPDDSNTSVQPSIESSTVAETLVNSASPLVTPVASAQDDYFASKLPPAMAHPTHRKIWVKRPGASATLVQIKEDDLVDDMRDMILRKYANSLGKTFDAPDMTLRIAQRPDHSAQRSERVLGPEEEVCRTLDAYYAGGQTVEDALLIDVPQKRTPRPSPRAPQPTSYHMVDEHRPQENGHDYFPPMPIMIPSTVPQTAGSHESRHHSVPHPEQQHPRSISVLNTGQLPPLPSPGGTRRHRPGYRRHPTTSPTLVVNPTGPTSAVTAPNSLNPLLHRQLTTRPRNSSSASEAQFVSNGIPAAPPLPSPPASEAALTNKLGITPSAANVVSAAHAHRPSRPGRKRRSDPDDPQSMPRLVQTDANASLGLANSMLDGAVPPINVLIVEDNIINLRILESLMKRLKVRWQTAMNGQIAVDKWKAGGFHLVLMDIQMPIMNGLQATKEIRRLERVNGIGVFSSTDSTTASPTEMNEDTGANGTPEKSTETSDDKLVATDGLFKSPIIIVALTASSLQSDRHQALAAGCNDFLTKPVNFMWLERKVKEWGCMQALIDFDGWRKWKDYAAEKEAAKSDEERKADAEKEEKARIRGEKMALLQEKQRVKKEQDERKKRRASLDPAVVPIVEYAEAPVALPISANGDGQS